MLDSIKIRPNDELLKQYHTLETWDVAVKQAIRSNHNRHRTGCVISWRFQHIAKGCAHKHSGSLKVNSIHAEMHAMKNINVQGQFGYTRPGASCTVVTLTNANNFANCSRPCENCAKWLQKYGISVTYAERTNDGGWAIREVPFDLLTEGYLKPTKYA